MVVLILPSDMNSRIPAKTLPVLLDFRVMEGTSIMSLPGRGLIVNLVRTRTHKSFVPRGYQSP